jgi:biotin synthase
LNRQDILDALTAPDARPLFRSAVQARRDALGDVVQVRAILELSSHCRSNCLYCGLRRDNTKLERYRLPPEDALETARRASAAGFGTVILQSGEDVREALGHIGHLVKAIRDSTPMSVTLSVGEWPREALATWRMLGADRYLLKFETSHDDIYRRLRPGRRLEDRLGYLRDLRALGYQVGSGNLVGLPGQTLGDVADDLLLMQDLDLDTWVIGPFRPHPDTPLADVRSLPVDRVKDARTQVLSLDLLDVVLRCVSISRLLSPRAHIPGTTALGALAPEGRLRALKVGANVLMQDVTPAAFRARYDIYPGRLVGDGDAWERFGAAARVAEEAGMTVQECPRAVEPRGTP